jgi:hypothetical protein
MNDYVIWAAGYYEGFCVVGKPKGFSQQFLLLEGVPLQCQWPEDVVCKMSPRYPKDIKLSDNLYGCGLTIVSGRLKERITPTEGGGQIEFLPVTVLNHKERVASKDYYLVNPLGSVDCIDIEKSGVVWNAIDTSSISAFQQLALKEDAIPPAVAIFRPTHRTQTILARRSLAEQLSADGFTGLFFTEPAAFKG